MGQLDLDFLSAAELDDQALAEITALLASRRAALISATNLIKIAASGDLIVARRPCGASPEIVGFAARIMSPTAQGETAEVVIAVDPEGQTQGLAEALQARLTAPPASIFRRRDRAPLGLGRLRA